MSNPTSFIRKLLQLRIFLIINLLILFFLALSFGREFVRNASIDHDIASLKTQKTQLESHNLELLSLGQTIQTQYFLEKEGRLKYGLAKPGEQLVIVADPNTQSKGMTVPVGATPIEMVPTEEASIEVPNTTRWWLFFFDHQAYQALATQYGS